MKKQIKKWTAVITAVLCMGAFLLTGCGDKNDFATYMKGQPAMRSAIETQLAILSSDAKGSIQYKEDGPEVTVTYYALTQKEIEGEEAEKCTERCNVILQDAVDQYHQDTGKTASVKVLIYGHDVEKK
ncbi:MAG: hypothetical protein IJ109_05825 [Firmicutes bacterium]|nr:hypothetical protein [Bacillota bacterium]MBQ9015624.1 hypothetical protein [Bacillota bacterium]MBQ9059949.1 hypothetical protein [Bacillota bacterium]